MPFAFLAVAGVADEIIANCRRRHTTVWPYVSVLMESSPLGQLWVITTPREAVWELDVFELYRNCHAMSHVLQRSLAPRCHGSVTLELEIWSIARVFASSSIWRTLESSNGGRARPFFNFFNTNLYIYLYLYIYIYIYSFLYFYFIWKVFSAYFFYQNHSYIRFDPITLHGFSHWFRIL